jgi:hypothetical protein
MILAKELLDIGEKEVVIEYLDLCTKFWESHPKTVAQWREKIYSGKVPSFRGFLGM